VKPGDFSLPIDRNHSLPRCRIAGTDDRLDVVHNSRARIQARDRRERGTEPRLTTAAFERVEKCGLLTADVRACARVHGEFEIEAAAQDVLSEVAGRVGLAHGRVQPPQYWDDFTTQIDEGMRRPDGITRDDDALDEAVRVREEERDVLARPGLRLVGVDN